jgi:hypothetical protein
LLIKGERDIQRVELPDVLSNPFDFHLLSPSEFVFSAADTLYSLRLGSKLAVVARGGLLWSRQIEGKILFGFYEERDGTKRGSVRRFVPGVGVEEIWSSSSFIPSMVQPARHGLFLDVWGGGHRKILYLAPEAGAPERVVWSEESDRMEVAVGSSVMSFLMTLQTARSLCLPAILSKVGFSISFSKSKREASCRTQLF